MDNLLHSEIFALTLTVGTYIAATILYKKTHLCLLHPLITSIFAIIAILKVVGLPYETYRDGAHLIHFLLGPSVVALGYHALIASLQPKSVTTPIAMGISEKAGGIPSLTAVIVVAVGIFGSIIGPFVLKILGIESRIAKGLALGASSHAVGTAAAIQIGAVEGAISGLAIGLMGIMTAVLVPIIEYLVSFF